MTERNRSLVSATALMASGTLISRVLGFVRVALLAFVFGNAGLQADGYNLAFAVSNGLYFLIAGGVLNTVLVPQIVRAIKNDADGGNAFVSKIVTAILTIMAALTVVLTIATPLVMIPYSGPEWRSPELAAQWQSVLLIAYLIMPQIFFYGLYVVLGQVLNAHGRFGPMMWTPIVNNVVSIAVLVGYFLIWGVTAPEQSNQPFTTAQAVTLGLGGLAGIVLQALVMIPYVRATGLKLTPRFDWRNAGLGHVFRLAVWTLAYMTVSQIGLMVTTNIVSSASTLGTQGAGLTAYTNARLLWQVPHSMITVSLATAMLPMVARLAQEHDLHGAAGEGLRTQKMAATVMVPATLAFAALAFPLSRILFGSGAGAFDYGFTAWTLIAACVGIIPFTVQYICLRLYYALEDTRTPALQQILIVGVNIALALAFVASPLASPQWLAPGMALAYSLSYVVGVFISWHNLRKKLPDLDSMVIIRHLVRVGLCALPAGAVALAISWFTRGWQDSLLLTVLITAVAGLLGLVIYFGMARVLRVREVNDIVATVLRRGGRKRGQVERAGADSDDEWYPGDDEPTEVFHFPEQSMDDPKTVLMPRIGAELPPAGVALEPEPPVDPGTFGIPDAPQRAAGPLDTTAEDEHPIRVKAGQELGHRYRLERPVVRREGSQSWQAWDSVLGRQVMVHLLPADSAQAESVLYASRSAAIATDSRFLRVLDVVPSATVTEISDPARPLPEADSWPRRSVTPAEPDRLAYVVTEWAEGSTLQDLLRDGPLTAVEAAWLLHELADALSGIHEQQIGHERLNPDTVVITPTGNVKIAGLLTEVALQPVDPHTDDNAEELVDELRDVHDLGRLLYACLLCRWPGGPAYGLGEAPIAGRSWLTPRQVRAGVSPLLDELCDRMLNPTPRHRKPPIHSSAELAGELTRVLAGVDAVAELEQRVRQQRSGQVTRADQRLPLARGIGPAHPPAPTPTTPPTPTRPPAPQIMVRSRSGETTRTAAIPERPPAEEERPERRSAARLIFPALLALAFVLVIAVARIIGGAAPSNEGEAGAPAQQQGTESAEQQPSEPQVHEIVAARDFDPQGDDQTENPDLVGDAVDGDPETAWRTLQYYNNPELGGAKRGVGLVLDLGEPVPVSTVDVLLGSGDTDLELRVPDPVAVDEPPMQSDEDWRSVASVDGAQGQTELTLDPAEETRYVLVYLTRLPANDEGNYQGFIYEVEVSG
ncbi:murein biosynthesis integral membrane protein MurJ [Naumannella halotolerans]|uniref:Murein biosynthesis integral membrane protein MurJ n=1 Tax=Naumannella halotolerans TaxID=993414 RepID=A0A4R7J1F9_9ACTN|nr:murein biosynthesis integral membrane protein MurJ [Naumannella halotolerans]TDT30981.1 murein biosynthesis integral membrane protein MurJ [Naumannella halotolerans]